MHNNIDNLITDIPIENLHNEMDITTTTTNALVGHNETSPTPEEVINEAETEENVLSASEAKETGESSMNEQETVASNGNHENEACENMVEASDEVAVEPTPILTDASEIGTVITTSMTTETVISEQNGNEIVAVSTEEAVTFG